ncbi:MAG: hypothetical protein IKE75_03565 [Bacilli bacterium]|nr:hypothetical protein [Bacilli bacterium]
MKNQIKKNFIYNTIGSVLYSFTSLFFMIIVTRVNGLDDNGIFTFAFSVACLFWVIGVYSGRIYQVTERDKKITDSDYIYSKFITCLIMIIVGLIYILLKNYDMYKFTVMLLLILYKVLNAFSESVYAIMQKREELYKVGISLFCKSIISVIVFLIVNLMTHNLICSSISLIITELIIMLVYDWRVIKGYNFKLKKYNQKSISNILKLGFPVFLFTILTQYLINAPKYAIDNFLDDSMQSIYGIISMVATLTVLLSQLILHPFINGMNEDLKSKKTTEFNNKVKKICILIMGIGLVELVLGNFLGTWALSIIYGIDLSRYTPLLLMIIIGSILYSVVSILSNALIAMRKNKSQSVLFLIDSILLYFLSNYMVKTYSLKGAAYSYLIGMALLLIMFIVLYIYEYRKLSGDKNENKHYCTSI